MMKNYKNCLLSCAVLAAALFVMGWALVKYDSEFLYRAQEQSLWMSGHLFLEESLRLPGGLMTWAAAYLTQYFYHPAWGVGILLALWAIIMLVLQRATRLAAPYAGILLLLPAALLASVVQMGYFMFYVKLQGYFFAATLGMLFVVLAMWGYRRSHYARLVWMLLVVAAGYPMVGAYSLVALGCMAAMAVCGGRQETSIGWKAGNVALAALLAVIVPLIYYNVYSSVMREELWVAGLPCMQSGNHDMYTLRYPYYAMMAAPILAVLASSKVMGKVPCRVKVCISVAMMALAGWGVSEAWFQDDLFDRELRMNRNVEEGNWEGVLKDARGGFNFVPTRLIGMYRNLALWKLGRSGDEQFSYRDGATRPKVPPTHYTNKDGVVVDTVPFTVRLPQVGGKLMYYHYGKANFCYRWGMEDAVEFGWRVEGIKYMAKACLLNHDWTLARRYLDMLRRTRFHKEWADHYAQFLDKPKRMEEDQEFAPILDLMCYSNRLDGDEAMVELYIMRTFANGSSDQPGFQELTLLCAMQTQDIQLFWPRFFRYAQMHPNIDHMPRHYQEAAYLYGHLESQVDISRMPFDESVKQSYNDFMAFNQQCGPMSEAQKARAFYPRFGNTFYYFYFFSRNMTTY